MERGLSSNTLGEARGRLGDLRPDLRRDLLAIQLRHERRTTSRDARTPALRDVEAEVGEAGHDDVGERALADGTRDLRREDSVSLQSACG